jgi:hypothetical protein
VYFCLVFPLFFCAWTNSRKVVFIWYFCFPRNLATPLPVWKKMLRSSCKSQTYFLLPNGGYLLKFWSKCWRRITKGNSCCKFDEMGTKMALCCKTGTGSFVAVSRGRWSAALQFFTVNWSWKRVDYNIGTGTIFSHWAPGLGLSHYSIVLRCGHSLYLAFFNLAQWPNP